MGRLSLTFPRLLFNCLLGRAVTLCLLPLTLVTACGAEPAESEAEPQHWVGKLLVDFRAATDALEWSDERIIGDWRVQRRPGTADGRILDPEDQPVASGSLSACLSQFAQLESTGQIPPVTTQAVIVLHGLGEGRQSMKPLAAHLQQELDATIMSFGYASPRAGLAAHAGSLAAVIAGLPQTASISFVGHSMGNLVVRRWLQMADTQTIARVRRMVMLGPPNQGSDLARLAAGNPLLAALAAGAARELVLHWETVSRDLRTPSFEYGIIAGGKGDQHGYTSLLQGDDDAVVRVAETRLEGADDFLILPVRHSRMMESEAVQQATLEFLKQGRFVTADSAAVESLP